MEAGHLSFAVFQFLCTLSCTCGVSQTEEFCQWENFRWSCDQDGRFILIQSAWYGRRSLGRCLRAEYGVMGCGVDAIHYVSSSCNGRRNCSFPVTSLHGSHGCPIDLGGQLFVGVTCVSMMTCTQHDCTKTHDVRVTSDPGYILVDSSTTPLCRGASCTWWLTTDAGRTISLSVLDYSFIRSNINETARGTRVCNRYAHVKEELGKSDLSGCSFVLSSKDLLVNSFDYNRHHHHHQQTTQGDVQKAYISRANRISLTLFSSQTAGVQFIIVYQARGCAIPELQDGVRVVQKNGSAVTMECSWSGEKWTMTCIDNTWKGQLVTCPQQLDMNDDLSREKNRSSYGVLLVVGLGILMGVLVGFTLLFLLICFMRSRSPSSCCLLRPHQQIDPAGNSDPKIEHSKLYYKDGDDVLFQGHFDEGHRRHVSPLTFSSDLPLYCVDARTVYNEEVTLVSPSDLVLNQVKDNINQVNTLKYIQRETSVVQE